MNNTDRAVRPAAGWRYDGTRNVWTWTTYDVLASTLPREGWEVAVSVTESDYATYTYRPASLVGYKPIESLKWLCTKPGHWVGQLKSGGTIHHAEREGESGHWSWYTDGQFTNAYTDLASLRYYAERFSRAEQMGCAPNHPRTDPTTWPLERLNQHRSLGYLD